jgi:hypothetical protein
MNIQLYVMFLVLQTSKADIVLCLRVRLSKGLILLTTHCANKVDVSAIYILLFQRSSGVTLFF